MAKGRPIDQQMSMNPALNEMSIEAHYCYMLALAHVDQDGLIDDDPDTLWTTICPLRDDLRSRMSQIIDEWIASKHVAQILRGPDRTALLFIGEHDEPQKI